MRTGILITETGQQKICEICAWTPEVKSHSNFGKTNCYCYYKDRTILFNEKLNIKEVINKSNYPFRISLFDQLRKITHTTTIIKRIPCKNFREIPTDMDRGKEFAQYFLTKIQMDRAKKEATRSFIIAIISSLISISAIIISII